MISRSDEVDVGRALRKGLGEAGGAPVDSLETSVMLLSQGPQEGSAAIARTPGAECPLPSDHSQQAAVDGLRCLSQERK